MFRASLVLLDRADSMFAAIVNKKTKRLYDKCLMLVDYVVDGTDLDED